MDCSSCSLPYCKGCSGLKDAVIAIILDEDEDSGMSWTCTPCKSTAPTLNNISTTLQHMCIQNDKRMDRMEDRVNHLEVNTKQIVKEEIVNSKKEIVGLMKDDIVAIFDERHKELEERKNKASNVILFNVPEPVGGKDNPASSDAATLQKISHVLISEHLKVVVHYRLGKTPVTGKIRPLVAILESREQRKMVLEQSRNLKTLAPPYLKEVVIVRDLTELQRQERRRKFEAKKAKEPPQPTSGELSPIPVNQAPPINPGPRQRLDGTLNSSSVEPTILYGVFDESTMVDETSSPVDPQSLYLGRH